MKTEYETIKAPVGSIIITPKEIVAFRNHGIELMVTLEKIQSEIYKTPKEYAKNIRHYKTREIINK